MASLDFIDNSVQGYAFVWRNRHYLFQCAIPVLFIKVLCILIIFALGIAGNPLREGLFLLPAHAIEALFLVSLVRFCLYQEPIYIWGKGMPLSPGRTKEAKTIKVVSNRKLAIEGGIALYLLIKVALGILIGIMALTVPQEYQTMQEPSLAKALLSLTLLAGLFWSVRLLWLYVPVSLGFSIVPFLRNIHGLINSFYFIGIVFICAGPLIMLYSFGANLGEFIFGVGSASHVIAISILQSIIVLSVLSIQTVAVSIGTYSLMQSKVK